VLLVSLYVQRKWRLFDLFIGKKHAFTVFVALQCLAWLEVVGVSILIALAPKDFSSLLFIGLPLFAYCTYAMVVHGKKLGAKSLFYSHLFKAHSRQQPQKTRMIFVVYMCGLFVGLSFIFGQFGFMYGAVALAAASGLVMIFEQKILA
jgi:hypothetical protein